MNTNAQSTQKSSEEKPDNLPYLPKTIEGTPLQISKQLENEEEIYVLHFGYYALRKDKSREELEEWVKGNTLNIATDIASIITDMAFRQTLQKLNLEQSYSNNEVEAEKEK